MKCVNESIEAIQKKKGPNTKINELLKRVLQKCKTINEVSDMQMEGIVDDANQDKILEIFDQNTRKFYLFT